MANNFALLAIYFSSKKKPVDHQEFKEFWLSCTEKEREYFRRVDLKTGLLPKNEETFIEKWCSICGKISWDNQTGYYNETHANPRNGSNYPCNMDGTRAESTNDGDTTFYYVDGTVKKYRDGFEVEGE